MDLEQLLQMVTDKRNAAIAKASSAQSMEELSAAELEIRKAEIEIKDLNAKIAERDAGNGGTPPEARKADEGTPEGGFKPVATYRSGTANTLSGEDEDMFSSMEYRKAFKDYVLRGTPIPEKYIEKRSDALTTVSDIGAVIPTTIQNKVIEDITVEGKILSRVNQTAYQGGIQIPISEINITGTWLESENVVSDEQKAEMKAKLTFGYHVLEAKVAIGLLSATVALPIFEATVVKQLKKAMVKSLETSIVQGSGSGEPLGFTKYTLPTEQVVTMATDTIGKVATWAGVEAVVPEAYEDNVIYVMSKATWEMYINGMTDTTGQKIGLGKINEKGQKILNGREVLTLDKFPSFAAAAEGSIFGAVVDLSQYCLNSNLAMYYKKYFDEPSNKWIHKSLMIADGKMAIGKVGEGEAGKLVGAKGLIYLKKGAVTPG